MDKLGIINTLLASPKKEQVFFLATVTQASPLRVRLDGDTEQLPYTPRQLSSVPAVSPGARVILLALGRTYLVIGSIGPGGSGGDGTPPGVIVMWGGAIAAIPSGWALCDGNNGTPDLRDRFVLGTGETGEIGETGGNHSITLTIGQLPAHGHSFTTGNESAPHSHTASTNSTGAHHHTGRWRGFDMSTTYVYAVLRRVDSGDPYTGTTQITHEAGGGHSHTVTVGNNSSNHTHSGTTNNAGSGQAIDNRPAFMKLAFIMKL